MTPCSAGPTIGSASRPMVSSAGADHVIFSKKLLVSLCRNPCSPLHLVSNGPPHVSAALAVILGLTAFLFFTIEQSRIAGNLAKSRLALKQTNNIKDANMKLQTSKSELEDEEAEYAIVLPLQCVQFVCPCCQCSSAAHPGLSTSTPSGWTKTRPSSSSRRSSWQSLRTSSKTSPRRSKPTRTHSGQRT